MSAHTLGPWSIESRGKKRVSINGDGWWDLARVVVVVDGEECIEGVLNARLIAAAPELLEAVTRLADDLEDGHWANTKAELRRLIAKATGA